MPFSFIEIEKTKTRKIYFLFIFLILFYFLSAWIVVASTNLFFFGASLETVNDPVPRSLLLLEPAALFTIFGAAMAVGLIHWYYSMYNMTGKILSCLDAHSPDNNDAYHKKFENIISEVSVATGGKHIESVILPVSAMNAFSVADNHGRAVIGISEGLLSRLNRAQLEAVVAHEAAHIVSGDAFINTVAVSLFGIYGALLEKIQISLSGMGERRGRYSSGSGRLGAYFIFMYVVLSVITLLGKLISTFLSRACEYRADAVAVRLARDPYSLAQSLYLITKKWRGSGLGYSHLQSLFIVNPEISILDDQENFFSNLFSTHPPTSKRLRVLLAMAHADFDALEKDTDFVKRIRSEAVTAPSQRTSRWFIHHQGAWQGPFAAAELLALGFFRKDLFVRREGDERIAFAYEHPELLVTATEASANSKTQLCPRCYQGLSEIYYESAPVFMCNSCKGILVEDNKIPRILLRQERGFSEEVARNAKVVADTARKPYAYKKVKLENELKCPHCAQKMLKRLYSLVYPITVDVCPAGGFTWFDRDELDILQYLVEKSENQP